MVDSSSPVEREELDLSSWAAEQPVNIPIFRDPFPISKGYVPTPVISGEGQLADYEDFKKLNEQIDALRIGLYDLSVNIREAELKLKKAQLEYKRNYDRAYLSVEAKTEQMRRTFASIQCEDFEDKVATREFIFNDLKRRSMLMVNELEALKTLAYNFRKEADLSR